MPRMEETLGMPVAPRKFWQKRKRWLALILLAGLVATVGLAPSLVATMPPLLQSIVDSSAPQLKGQVQIGGASLGWFSPVILRDVVWRDLDGKTVAQASAVRLERTLWQVVSDSRTLGAIHVEQPQLSLVLRDDGSNLEDALAPLLEQASDEPLGALSIVIAGGSVEVVDGAQQLAWQLEQIEGSVTLPAHADEPSQVALQGQIHDSQGIPRPVNVQYAWHTPRAQPQAGEPGGTLVVKTTDTPLAMLRPVLRRFVTGADLNGVASCDLQLVYNADGSQQQLELAQLAGKDLLLAAPQWLGSEALQTAELAASGVVQLGNGRLKFTGVKFNTDFARGSADGQVPLAGWDANASGTALAALQGEDYVVSGELDLAKLAALLPETLRIREGTEITSGLVTMQLTSRSQGKKRRWDAELKSSQLAAMQNGREIVWDAPITVTLAAQQTTTGPVIERLSCVSSFLSLQARGTLDQGDLTASGDLAQLLVEINRFVDLDEVRLAGKLDSTLAWRRSQQNAFSAQGQADITNFELLSPGQQPWREPQLTFDLIATGSATVQGLSQLDTALVRMIAGEDQLQVELTSAIRDPWSNRAWPLTCSMRGELARWLPRVRTWLPLTVDAASGAAWAQAEIISSPQALQVRQFKIDVADMKMQTLGMTIVEPEVHLAGDGTWNFQTGRFQSETLTIATSALACRGDKLVVEPRASGVAVTGDIGYRADLERLAGWLNPPGSTPSRRWLGATEGRLKFTHQGNLTQAKWTAEFQDLVLERRRPPRSVVSPVSTGSEWESIWQEPLLSWHGQGEFDHVRNRLIATHLNLTSYMINVTARGQIDAVTTAPIVDLNGELAYDLPNVGRFLSAYLGDGLQMSGVDKRQFVLRGPLPTTASFASHDRRAPPVQKLVWPKELVGRAGFGWTSAALYDLPLGAANIDGSLENGVINFAPIDVRVADGRIQAWPRLVLSNDPMVFQLAKGTRAEQVAITPQMCQTWLKYVAPLLADATRADGKFSLAVEGATFPLTAPATGDARGTMTVHGARVGPGPLAEQYVYIARYLRAVLERKPLDPNFRAGSVEWLNLPQQDVQLEMKGGRVYHQNLQIQVQDTLLVTSGSVGADQSLALIVEVPIRDEWIAKDRLLSGLRGRSVKVPIGGTVTRPQLDSRALEQLASQLFQNAAGGLLENTLKDGLNKFLPK